MRRGDGGPEAVTQWRLQQFCGPAGALLAGSAEALAGGAGAGRAAGRPGHDAHAGIARSEATQQILLAGDAAADRGRSILRQRSGIEPPQYCWGAVMGSGRGARRGALTGWRWRWPLEPAAGGRAAGAARQAEITISAITGPHPDLGGRAPYEDVLEEAWIVHAAGARPRAVAPLETRLREPGDSGTAARAIRRGRWHGCSPRSVTGDADRGGYLSPRTVSCALDELGWREELIGASSRELDAYPAPVLREAAHRLGLICG